ncbi:hypothetical protein PGIGA_G00195950 [Pangasianodon gigas]|uniref:Uncharacterized protein n=1 Tax=Pangasianodon gigas TaxID=30993 RepID=A0ACC5XX15_PANGG|nr:hypothetical protein [Pangasianodon gigas]
MIKTNSNTIEELKSSLLFVNAEIVDLQKSKVELTAKVTEQARARSQLENSHRCRALQTEVVSTTILSSRSRK